MLRLQFNTVYNIVDKLQSVSPFFKQVVSAVNNVEKLAADLLPIAGRRMMAYLSKTPDLLEEVSRISPALTKYLESLVSIIDYNTVLS